MTIKEQYLTPTSDWEAITAPELRTAAKVARASGGMTITAATAAWEKPADDIDDWTDYEERAR